jgi:hypothetical protein
VIYDGTLQTQATGSISSAIPRSLKSAKLIFNAQAIGAAGNELVYTSNRLAWSSSENNWNSAGNITAESVLRLKDSYTSLDWDASGAFGYGSNMYMFYCDSKDINGSEDFYAGAHGGYAGRVNDW